MTSAAGGTGLASRERSTSNRRLTVAALLLAMFMAAMEATVVATAMPTVIAELGGLALYGWVGAGYLLASTVTVPVFGKLADRSGRKPILLLGITLFVLGSLLCGLATSIELLIVYRVIQGLGAGAVQPIVLTIIGDLYTPAERGRVQGLFGAVWGSAAVAGPLLGGALVHAVSWPWVFWINLPFGAVAMAVLMFAFREQRRERSAASLDWAGAFTVTVASLSILLFASGVAPVLTLGLGVLMTGLFVYAERRAKDPIVPLPLLAQRLIAVTTLVSFLLGAAMMGMLIFLPLHVQGVLGYSPTESGLVVAPMLVGWPIAASITSRILVRVGYRRPVQLGTFLSTVGLLAIAPLASAQASGVALGVAMFVFGLGMGFANTTIVIGVQASVGWEQRGVATATTMFARTMGGALGVGGLGALLAYRLRTTISADAASGLLDPHKRAEQTLDPAVVEGLAKAVDPLLWSGAVAGAITLAVVLLAYPADAPKSSPERSAS